MQSPNYQVLIDWDADGGLLTGDFEDGADGWNAQAIVVAAPTIAVSTVRAYHGDASLLVTWSAWAGGSIQLVQTDLMTGFIAGRSYTMSARAWVPSTGGAHVLCAVAGIGLGAGSSLTDQWQEISYTFTATGATHLLQIWVGGTPAGGSQTWIDYARVLTAGEDVGPGGLNRMPWQSALDIRYGRDQARALAPVAPGRLTGLELDNVDRDYSPLNSSSPLSGLLGPGREVAVTAAYSGKVYSLYRGYLDGFGVSSDLADRRASFTAVDGLVQLKGVSVATAVYPAARTGEAIGHILDAAGWTRGRDLDPGASTVRWWYADGDDALAAITELIEAEGPSATAYIGPAGQFVFRDRHHRLIRDASTTVQATFRDAGAEPLHDPPVTVDYGWRDVINRVEVKVDEREPAGSSAQVWIDETAFVLDPGQAKVITVRLQNPVWAAIPPTWGGDDPDIVTVSAVSVTSELSRTSGQTLELTLRTLPSASPVVVSRVRLRAQPITTVRSLTVSGEDTSSSRKGRKTHRPSTPWLTRHDAEAIVDLILGQRAERRPVITFTVINSSATALTQQLTRDLSDRVHVIDAEAGFVDDCYVEQIHHRISDGGRLHVTTFAAETVPTIPADVFRFDVTGAGFDDGVFAPSGIDDPDTIFRFDTAGQGFDEGVFAT